MDMHIGRPLDHLKKIGQYNRTVIVVVRITARTHLGSHRLLYQEDPCHRAVPHGPRGRYPKPRPQY
jgi:hypothetical protein